MKAFVLSLFLLSWRHGAALTAEPEPVAAESVLAEQGDDETEMLSEQREKTNDGQVLPASDTFLASYDQKLDSMTHEADALKEKLMAYRHSSMARLAHRKKGYQQKLRQAKQENQKLANSNKELDKEVIRLQRQVAKKAAHLQKLQNANREKKRDMEQIAKELEAVNTVFDKAIDTAKTKAEAVIGADVAVAEPLEPTIEHQDDSAEAPDPEERQVLMSARFGYIDAMPKFDKGRKYDATGIGEQEEPSGVESEQEDKELSLLSLSISKKANQTQTGLVDFEPASLVELLTNNLANLRQQEESGANVLLKEFKRRVKDIFHERQHLRKRERALQAMQKKLTKYEGELNVSTQKAERAQQFLADEINKESNYLRKAKKHLQ